MVWSGEGDIEDLLPSLQWAEYLEYSAQDALESATIQSELQDDGARLPIADVMLAGVARNRGATVVTRDTHFEQVAGLDVDYYAE